MRLPKRKILFIAVTLALAAGSTQAALERMGPVSRAPSIGGFPTWFQDKSGITIEFCDLKNQAELDGGWCVLIPPGLSFPETFPNTFFAEHFYWAADNGLSDPSVGGGFRARMVLAVEAAFAGGGPPVDGDQMTFGRHRVFLPRLPFDGDYRIITPFSDITYYDQVAGARIFETSDVGIACINTFECTLDTAIGPYLLPSPVAGGAEVPPMPDLASAPAGTDPFYDLLVNTGAPSPAPGTGKQYISDPARIGPVTGSPLPPFMAYEVNGSSSLRNHNTFRIEVRAPSATHDGPVIYVIDGENNFATRGRLMTDAVPGKVNVARASYAADNSGRVTTLDVFAKASTTVQPRVPAQASPPPAIPVLSFFNQPCAGAVATDINGNIVVNPGPYGSPGGIAKAMASTGHDFWAQTQPGGLPPSHVCVEDATARNAAGQVTPAYYLKGVTDDVTVNLATFDGPNNGTLRVQAASTDPTAKLTLEGYGPAPSSTPGNIIGTGAGTGLDLVGGNGKVTALQAPPAQVQIVSTKGAAVLEKVVTAQGQAALNGVPIAVNDSGTINEDCSASPALACAPGQGLVIDLLANDTVKHNGAVTNLRTLASSNTAVIVVTLQAPRLGTASVVDGLLTYRPNPNANGVEGLTYTVSVDGVASTPAAVSINITPVNDAPVAANDAIDAVAGRNNSLNLIARATDPDGKADVTDAVIVFWPAVLGAQPVPVNGVITFNPLINTVGPFNVTYRVKDASNVQSANIATGIVTVKGAEAITFAKAQFVGAGRVGGATSTRWTVTGADTVRAGQTLSVVYNSGVNNLGVNCGTNSTHASCLIGTAVVDGTGVYTLDKVGTPGGLLDPNDPVTWPSKPGTVRVFSSAPVLGGTNATGISFK